MFTLIRAMAGFHNGGAPMTSAIAAQVLKIFSEMDIPQIQDYHLSERGCQVLELFVNGYSYKLIASEMFMSIDGVRQHIRKLYEKLHVNPKSAAVGNVFKDKLV